MNTEINVGLAIAVKDGVVTAVLPGADRLAPTEISELGQRAKNGRLKSADMASGTLGVDIQSAYRN